MPGEFLAGDPHAWREETRSILLTGTLNVPRDTALIIDEQGQYFPRNERNGLYYSKFGIANSLIALPPMWLDRALGGDIARRGYVPSLLLANLWNLALCVALAWLLYRLASGYTPRIAVRVLFVVGVLYCTSLWFYQRAQSSEIYQTLFFTALFIALTRFLRPLKEHGAAGLDARAWRSLGAVWTFAALLVFVRIVNGLLLPIIVVLATWCAAGGRWGEMRKAGYRFWAALLVPPALIVLVLGIVNQVKFGAPWLTGYHQWRAETHLPTGRLADGLWGYLFSPRFSIFLYFPLLFFAAVGLPRFLARHRLDAIAMLSIFGAFLLLLSKTPPGPASGPTGLATCCRCCRCFHFPSSRSPTKSSSASAPGARAHGASRRSAALRIPPTFRCRSTSCRSSSTTMPGKRSSRRVRSTRSITSSIATPRSSPRIWCATAMTSKACRTSPR